MRQSRVTIRYAKALLKLSIEQNTLEQSYNDMVLLDAVCTENRDLVLLLKSPIVKTDQKLSILKEIFAYITNGMEKDFLIFFMVKKKEC